MATTEDSVSEKITKLRFDRMRLGKASCEIVDIPSFQDEGVRVALVPLTESEYDQCLEMGSRIEAEENAAGFLRRDRWINSEILSRAVREPGDLETRVFLTARAIQDALEVSDLNFLMDRYYELVEKSSPMLDGFTEEEVEEAKKVLQLIDWNGLYGPQWYALKRFLSTISPTQLGDNSPGFGSIKQLITRKSERMFTATAEESSTPDTAKSATNPSTEKEFQNQDKSGQE